MANGLARGRKRTTAARRGDGDGDGDDYGAFSTPELLSFITLSCAKEMSSGVENEYGGVAQDGCHRPNNWVTERHVALVYRVLFVVYCLKRRKLLCYPFE